MWIPKIYNGRDKTFFFFNWESGRLAQGDVAAVSNQVDELDLGERAADPGHREHVGGCLVAPARLAVRIAVELEARRQQRAQRRRRRGDAIDRLALAHPYIVRKIFRVRAAPVA